MNIFLFFFDQAKKKINKTNQTDLAQIKSKKTNHEKPFYFTFYDFQF